MIDTTNASNEIESIVPGEQNTAARGSESLLIKLLANPYVHAAALVAIVVLCFGRTLSSYFLADDFGEVSYVSRIFNGEPQLFWSNFTGNYMQIPGMNVYRPWLLVSLVLDFLLFKANATGYYFTNLASYTCVVLLVYCVTRQLTKQWTRLRSCAAAFFGAALFAANPLRCESVSWVVGRVDIVCCVFYLSSYLLFLKSRLSDATAKRTRNLLIAAGVSTFFLAMGTKEMAIGLPGLLFVTELFGVGKPLSARSPLQRLRDAMMFSAPLWISAVVYFVIRYACLGTLGGGYVAGFGASQLSFMVQRWLDPDTIKRLFFPFCHSLFAGQTVYSELLTGSYGALVGLTAIRLFDKKISLQWFLFLLGWMATAAVPIFQLWGLGFDLEGSRFYFFLSIPICLTAPLLLFRPSSNARSAAELKILVATAVALSAVAAILGRAATLTDLEWVHAGKENRQVSVGAQKLVEERKTGSLTMLGIPKERNGAHQILNGSTFDTMLNPPFTTQAYADRFETFDPIMFGPSEYIDASRFKRVVARSNGQFFVWKTDDAKFSPASIAVGAAPVGTVSLPLKDIAQGWLPHSHSRSVYDARGAEVTMTHIVEGDALRLDGLSIEPASADFLEFEYKATAVPEQAKFTVFATGSAAKQTGISESAATQNMEASANFKTVRVRLSKQWKWFCLGKINALVVQPYPCGSVTFRNFKLVSADQMCPSLSVVGQNPDGTGVVLLDGNAAKLSVSTQSVPKAKSFAIEIGKPNYFFNNFEGVKGASPVAATLTVPTTQHGTAPHASTVSTPQTSSTTENELNTHTAPTTLTTTQSRLAAPSIIELGKSNLADFGFYDVRARCLDGAGNPIGEYSDTVTLRVGRAQQVSK